MMIYEKERISGGLTLTVQEMVKPNAQADALPHGEPRRVDPVEERRQNRRLLPGRCMDIMMEALEYFS